MLIPGPSDPYGVADAWAEHRDREGLPPLRYWRGDWHIHRGTRWELREAVDVRADLVDWLMDGGVLMRDRDGGQVPWRYARSSQIRDIVEELQVRCRRDGALEPTRGTFLADVWLDEQLQPQDYSPGVWNTSTATYGWDIRAECPRTIGWLSSILPAAEVQLVREWLGYLVSGRTDLQKMLVVIGPPRSGKGTLLWLMEKLLGPGSTASVASLKRLSETFGIEPLIGAQMAVMPDARWSGEGVAEAVPEILSITGDDTRDVHRKNRPVWRGRLGVRFVAASNDTPSLSDASGALAGRMLTIVMGKSFLGKEDVGLRAQLESELPGILQWAIGGLRELQNRGRFSDPEASEKARVEAREAGNPVYIFVEDKCVLGPYGVVRLAKLYDVYERWCKGNGFRTQSSQWLSRRLQDTFRGRVVGDRVRRPGDGVRERILLGITIRDYEEYADEALYEIGEFTDTGRSS